MRPIVVRLDEEWRESCLALGLGLFLASRAAARESRGAKMPTVSGVAEAWLQARATHWGPRRECTRTQLGAEYTQCAEY